MTQIKKITAKGFKSFAEKTEIIFGDKFNVILGPNGSGKSNVTDSICFVLGKSSARGMRAEKAANLIFNGGKLKKPANEATVSIEFDNSKKEFPIDTDDLTITRTVNKNGQSTYRINGEKRTRQQVLDTLSSAKIDPDGHNIILQGDIIQFMEMRSVQRREIIEEISGISIYEDKKNKCLLELEKVESRLKEANIILTEREANLRELKKDRDQARRYKELETLIKDYKATHLHLQLKDRKEKVEDVESKIKKEESQLESIQKTINELKEEIINSKESVKEINKEVEEKGEKEQLALRKKAEDLKEIIIRTSSRIDVCNTEIIKIKQRNIQLKNNIQETEERIQNLTKSKTKLQSQLVQEEVIEKEILKKIQEFKQRNNLSTDQSKTIEEIDKTLNILNDENLEVQEQRRELQQNKYQTEFILKEINRKIEGITGPEGLKIKGKEKLLDHLKIEIGKLIETDSKLASQIQRLREDLNKKSEELGRQQTRQAKISEFTLADRAIKSIIEIKKQINGIYGTVSELGEVDPKYSLALEVAAGARILSVVVNDDSVAHKCINFLKDNKLGIATFLPLNKLKEMRNIPIPQEKGIEGKAIDLVKFDPKFKAVFSQVFGSTIIVKDLNTARKIGVGKIRMVSLEGDLIESSGAMIGGFRNKVIGLGFKEKDIKAKVTKLENEIQMLREEVLDIEQSRLIHEKELQKLRENRANMEGEIIQTSRSLGIGNLTKLKEEKIHYSNLIEKDEIKIKGLIERIKENNHKQESLRKKMFNFKSTDTKVTKELEELETTRFTTKDNINSTISDIRTIESQINNILSPEIIRIEKILRQQEKESEMFGEESNQLQLKVKVQSKELNEIQKEESKYQNSLKELIQKRNKINEKITNIEKIIGIQEEKQRAYQSRINNFNIDRAKFVAESEGIEKEFEDYKEGTIKRGFDIPQLKLKIKETEQEIHKIGNVNLRALEIYEELQVELQKLIGKSQKLDEEKNDVLGMMNEIEKKKIRVFMKTYNIIAENFKKIFNELTTKGEVNVVLEDKENPFEGGIEIQIRLTSKKFMDIKGLSGGEKTIAALAFIFAIQEYNPSPFYLLDEVDAALDKKNTETLTKLIQKYANHAQYIVISHNDNVITEADQVYGVSMQEGVSKVISLKV